MKIGNLDVFVNNQSKLIIQKSSISKFFGLIFYSLVFVSIVGFMFWFIYSSNKFPSFDLFSLVIICLFIVVLVSVLIYNLKRTVNKHNNYSVTLQHDRILINDVFFGYNNDLSQIIIVKFTDGDGMSFYNVMLSSNNQQVQVALDLDREEALSLSNILSEFLGIRVVVKNKDMIIP